MGRDRSRQAVTLRRTARQVAALGKLYSGMPHPEPSRPLWLLTEQFSQRCGNGNQNLGHDLQIECDHTVGMWQQALK